MGRRGSAAALGGGRRKSPMSGKAGGAAGAGVPVEAGRSGTACAVDRALGSATAPWDRADPEAAAAGAWATAAAAGVRVVVPRCAEAIATRPAGRAIDSVRS